MAAFTQGAVGPALATDRYVHPPARTPDQLELLAPNVRNTTIVLTFNATTGVSLTTGQLRVLLSIEATQPLPAGVNANCVAVRQWSSSTVLPEASIGGPGAIVAVSFPPSERTPEGGGAVSVTLDIEAYMPTLQLTASMPLPTEARLNIQPQWEGVDVDPATPGTDDIVMFGDNTAVIYRAVNTAIASNIPAGLQTAVGGTFHLFSTMQGPRLMNGGAVQIESTSVLPWTQIEYSTLDGQGTITGDGTAGYVWNGAGSKNAIGTFQLSARVQTRESGAGEPPVPPRLIRTSTGSPETMIVVSTQALEGAWGDTSLGDSGFGFSSTTPQLQLYLPLGSEPSYRVSSGMFPVVNTISMRVRMASFTTEGSPFVASSATEALFGLTFEAPMPLPEGFSWVDAPGASQVTVDGPAEMITGQDVIVSAQFMLTQPQSSVPIGVYIDGDFAFTTDVGGDATFALPAPVEGSALSVSDIVSVLTDRVVVLRESPGAAVEAEDVANEGGLSQPEVARWADDVYSPYRPLQQLSAVRMAPLVQVSARKALPASLFQTSVFNT